MPQRVPEAWMKWLSDPLNMRATYPLQLHITPPGAHFSVRTRLASDTAVTEPGSSPTGIQIFMSEPHPVKISFFSHTNDPCTFASEHTGQQPHVNTDVHLHKKALLNLKCSMPLVLM